MRKPSSKPETTEYGGKKKAIKADNTPDEIEKHVQGTRKIMAQGKTIDGREWTCVCFRANPAFLIHP